LELVELYRRPVNYQLSFIYTCEIMELQCVLIGTYRSTLEVFSLNSLEILGNLDLCAQSWPEAFPNRTEELLGTSFSMVPHSCALMRMPSSSNTGKFQQESQSISSQGIASQFSSGSEYILLVGFRDGSIERYQCSLNEEGNPSAIQFQRQNRKRIGRRPVILLHVNDLTGNTMTNDYPSSSMLHPFTNLQKVLALCDQPWLIEISSKSNRILFTSISFGLVILAASVSFLNKEETFLFISENILHAVSLQSSSKLTVSKVPLAEGLTSKRVYYHPESRRLLVICVENATSLWSLNVLDPLSGYIYSNFDFERGETAFSIQRWYVDSCTDYICVGTAKNFVQNSPCESGRLLFFQLEVKPTTSLSTSAIDRFQTTTPTATESAVASPDKSSLFVWTTSDEKTIQSDLLSLRLVFQMNLPGMVYCIHPYQQQFLLVSASNKLLVLRHLKKHSSSPPPKDDSNNNNHTKISKSKDPEDISMDTETIEANLIKVVTSTGGSCRFPIVSISSSASKIVLATQKEGLLFYTFQENIGKLEFLGRDLTPRVVSDAVLLNDDFVFAIDKYGNAFVLSCPEASILPEGELQLNYAWINCVSSFSMRETALRVRKGSFAYLENKTLANSALICASLLGSVVIFLTLDSNQYRILQQLEAVMEEHTLTKPLLYASHLQYRSQLEKSKNVIDGDFVSQFAELKQSEKLTIIKEIMPNGDKLSVERSLNELLALLDALSQRIS